MKTLNFPSKIGDFQHLPRFSSIHMFEKPPIFAFEGIPHVKYEKNIYNAHFLTFFTTLGLIWLKFCPKSTATLIFLPGF